MSETIVKTNKRHPWLAVTLSLVMPGLGHIYCGRIVKGLLLAFLAGLPLPLIAIVLATSKLFLITTITFIAMFVHILIHLIAIIDSGYTARHTKADYKLKDYNRWYVYILFMLIGTGGSMELALNVKKNYLEAFWVPVASNYPTIVPGDRLLANKITYKNSDPIRGDMVVFLNPENRRINFIKRVVAIAGDTVEIKDGQLYINEEKLQRRKLPQSTLDNIRVKIEGQPLDGEVFEESNGDAKYKIFLAKPPHNQSPADFTKITVPKGHCFTLGDNRRLSHDSRHFGPVPLVDIKGRADCLYFPGKDWSRFGQIN
jgi:signal peptidase I